MITHPSPFPAYRRILLCGATLTLLLTSTAMAAPQPVARWTLDADAIDGTTVKDRGPNGHHGQIRRATLVVGRLGEALAFDASGDTIFVHTGRAGRADPNMPLAPVDIPHEQWTHLAVT